MAQNQSLLDRAEIEQAYANMLGEVPLSLKAKFDVFGDVAERALIAIENARAEALTPSAFSPKEVQLLQFAMYVALGSQVGADVHALAAMRLGARREELAGVAGIAFVAQGVPALNLGVAAILAAEATRRDEEE